MDRIAQILNRDVPIFIQLTNFENVWLYIACKSSNCRLMFII
jgi:hypothetical protein